MLELARVLEVEVNVPEAVIVELECQFERELRAAQKEAVAACNRFVAIAGSRYEPPELDVAAAIKNHNAQLNALLREYRINVIPFTERSHAELFRMAAMRQRPFRETSKTVTDAGFKDAIIYTSVVDHLRSRARRAAFVSRDTDYVGAERLLEGRSLVKASAAEILTELRRRTDARLLAQADERRCLADADLHRDERHAERIKEYARAHFVVPDLMPVPFGFTRQITNSQILAVEVRNLVPLREDVEAGQQVRLTVNVLGRIYLTPGAYFPPDVITAAASAGEDLPNEPRPFDVVGVLEVRAVRTRKGYTDFEPLSMNVPTGLLSQTKHQKLDADAWVKELRASGNIE